MDNLLQDLRYALRQMGRAPGFTLLAAAMLAVGIGANTALFSFANAILLRPRPGVHDPARLVWVGGTQGDPRPIPLSNPDFRDLEAGARGALAMAAFNDLPVSLSGGAGAPEQVNGQIVSGGYFAVLGAPVALGRGLAPADDAPGAPPAAVLGHELWMRRFGGRADVVGTSVKVNGQEATVVGVAAPGFNGAEHGLRQDVWIPLAMAPRAIPAWPGIMEMRGWPWLRAVGRPRPGVGEREAAAAVSVAAARIARAHPDGHEGWSARLDPARLGLPPGDVRVVLAMSAAGFAVTGLVLLIACANVSSLLLGRAAARRREIGIRLSLGAGRGRLVRQLLTESVLLAGVASAAGLVLAAWAAEALVAAFPIPFPVLDLRPDARVLAFCAAAAMATGVVFGVVPALDATRADLAGALKDGAAGPDPRRARLQGRFVAAQVALSLVLLATAGLFLKSLRAEGAVEPGFDASERVLALSFDLGLQGYDDARAAAFLDAVSARARALPGVAAVSATDQLPMGPRLLASEVLAETAPGARPPAEGSGVEAVRAAVLPDYFAAAGVPLLRGRGIASGDGAGAPPVAVVSERLARALWPGRDAVGRRLSVEGPDGPYLTVVGVAAEARFEPASTTPHPAVYLSHAQNPRIKALALLVRSGRDARPLAAALRREVRALDPDLPLRDVSTLAEVRRRSMAGIRVGSTLLSIFGALALLLAAAGVYGVAAFAVSQRTREIGVRVALGARAADVTALFVRQALRTVVVGGAVGMALAAAVGRVLEAYLYDTRPLEMAALAGAAGVMGLAALAASWLPARRAARVDPVRALRAE